MTRLKLFFVSYLLLIIVLFFYTFTQVDLSLTLSGASTFQTIEKQLQYIGFYQRPTSAIIFSTLLALLFILYLFFLYLSKKNKIQIKNLKFLTFFTFVFLVFSYNSFSYDIFNYIFDAKIVTFYHQNPYLHKALDFPNDPMLSFMRWTHRVYPYGPAWLLLTVPLSFLGINLFLPTFFLFKLLMGLSYLGVCVLIYKISEILFPENKIINTVFWAFNPLVIIESLISAHNDVPMIFFALLSMYLFLRIKNFYSFMSYLFSVLIKFSTGILFPLVLTVLYSQKTKKKVNWELFFVASFFLSLLVVLIATLRTTFQPWYLLFSISLAAFIPNKFYILIPSLISSFFAAGFYIPYVLLTDYSKTYPEVIFNILLTGISASVFLTFVYFFRIKLRNVE